MEPLPPPAMPLRPHRLAVLLVLVAASGCTPRAVYRLSAPDPDAGVWREGQQVRTARAADIEAQVAYVRSYADDHAFWVRVTNHSADTVLVDPALFELIAYRSPERAAARDSSGSVARARDPEAELLQVDLTASRRDAHARTRQGLAAGTAALTAVATLADAPGTPDEEAAVADTYLAVEVEIEDAGYARRAAAEAQAEGRAYWEGVLRRTTLPPNTYIDGVVLVPIDAGANVVVFEPVVGETRVPFWFVQRSYRP